MKQNGHFLHALLIIGFIAMILGVIDPLEGLVIILFGAGLVALCSFLLKSQHSKITLWAFILTLICVALLWGMSALGGIGGSTGRSYWWAILLIPYPSGWIMSLVAGVKVVRESHSLQQVDKVETG